MAHQQLNVEEREEIQLGLWRKESVRSIARRLGRSHSSIVREINKNIPRDQRRYTPRLANERALENRKSRGRTDLSPLRDVVSLSTFLDIVRKCQKLESLGLQITPIVIKEVLSQQKKK